MPIRYVVDNEFRKVVLQADKPTLVSFRAPWCVPSQNLVPHIDEVAEKYGDRVQFVAVDMGGDTSAICRKYKVNRLPVTMLFHKGRRVDAIGGVTSKESIVSMLEQRLAPVRNVDEFDFDIEVLAAQLPVLVHFDAPWCQPSQALVQVVSQAAQKYEGVVKVVRVNFGPDTARLCARWGVNRVPTLALFVNGEIRDEILGGMVGGAKAGGRTTSCVGLTALDNISGMVERLVL